MSSKTRVQYTVDGGVAEILIDNPRRRNALDLQGWLDLGRALEEASIDASVRVVVLTGKDGDLCSGMDLGDPDSPDHPLNSMRILNRVAQRLFDMPKPVVGVVDGVAVGAGLSLALACDFVLATPDSRFSAIFARRGLSLDCGAAWGLMRHNDLHTAKRVTMLGEMIGGKEALSLGWATWLVDPSELADQRNALVARLLSMSPRALAESKTLLNHAACSTLADSLSMEALAQTVNMATDAPEAFDAFSERRDPQFDGRWRVQATSEVETTTCKDSQ